MLFHSLDFFLFFPFILAGHFSISNNQLRILFLLIVSYVFYMWNAPINAVYLIFSTLVTYLIGLRIPKAKFKKTYLIMGLFLNFGLLFFFKAYDPFFPFLKTLFPELPYHSFSLPLGLSFYTFQAVSYIVDIYRKDLVTEKNFFTFSLYHSFFPQLMAGPIERAKNLLPQLKEPQLLNYENFRRGALIFGFGLIKKLVIADRLAAVAETTLKGWQTNTSYAVIFSGYPVVFQYYFDFSAYSEIALGVALMMGIQLTRNFNSPFLATSPIDFWRRWHISLMTWLHDYVFMPIIELEFTFFNMMIATFAVFIFAGAWHGIGLTFVIWGMINGLFVILNMIYRKFAKRSKNKFLIPFKIIGTFHLFVISGFFLSYDNISIASTVFLKIFSFQTFHLRPIINLIPVYDQIILGVAVPLVMLGEILFFKINFWNFYTRLTPPLRWTIYTLMMLILILFSYSKARPYVYFKF